MLKDYRVLILFSLVIVIAIWIHWWASSGFILSHEICSDPKATDDCEVYDVLFYSAWAFGKTVDRWSALITAIATGVIGFFTFTLYKATTGMVEAAKIQSNDMKRSIAASEVAAAAAEKSADVAEKALFAANPIITIAELELRDANETIEKTHIHWGLRNSGPGMGVVHTMHTRTGIAVETPDGIRVFRSKETIGWGSAIETKDTASGFSITTPMLQSRIGEIRTGSTILTFVIQTDGQNIFKDRFSALFSFKFDHLRQTFVRVGTEGPVEGTDTK
jgi:hypothetical protein